MLHAAEAAYTGDFLEEDPYEDWATELREEARLTYVQVAIVLAMHTSDAGEHVTASRYCLRILERDQYNEPAHSRWCARCRRQADTARPAAATGPTWSAWRRSTSSHGRFRTS